MPAESDRLMLPAAVLEAFRDFLAKGTMSQALQCCNDISRTRALQWLAPTCERGWTDLHGAALI